MKYLFNPEEQEQIISAKMYKNDYLLGTLSSKLMILRQNGELIRKPSSFLKLFNSTILDVQSSQDENSLWVLMNNGLDYVEFNSPVSHLFDS